MPCILSTSSRKFYWMCFVFHGLWPAEDLIIFLFFLALWCHDAQIDLKKGMDMITKAADGGIFKANYMLAQVCCACHEQRPVAD